MTEWQHEGHCTFQHNHSYTLSSAMFAVKLGLENGHHRKKSMQDFKWLYEQNLCLEHSFTCDIKTEVLQKEPAGVGF